MNHPPSPPLSRTAPGIRRGSRLRLPGSSPGKILKRLRSPLVLVKTGPSGKTPGTSDLREQAWSPDWPDWGEQQKPEQPPSSDGSAMSAPKTETVSFVSGELFGSKQRALLQRRKNRVLFDLHHGLDQLALDRDKLIDCFKPYRAPEGKPIMRAVAERRMLENSHAA